MNTNSTANKAAPQAPIGDDEKFNYCKWEWDLLKPADLFTPANELTITEERVAMRLHAHANIATGFCFPTAQRIASLMERDRGPDKARRGASVQEIYAARAVLRRRGFIEPGYGKDHRGNVRKGYYLKNSHHWLHRSGAKNDTLAGPQKSLLNRVFSDEDNSAQASEKLGQTEFRTPSDLIEGTDQELLPFQHHQQSGAAAHAADDEKEDEERKELRAMLDAKGIDEPTLSELAGILDLRAWHIKRLATEIVGGRSQAAILISKIRNGRWREFPEPLAILGECHISKARASAEARFVNMSRAERWGIINGGLLVRHPGLGIVIERHRSANTDPFTDDEIRRVIIESLAKREDMLVDTIEIDLENKTT